MNLDERPTLLAIQHVPWEGPHRILDACHDLHLRTVKPLAGHPLPGHDEVAGAVVMGGPINVDEVERFPGLAAEREWLAEAVERGMPVLGICLGAQLLARALGMDTALRAPRDWLPDPDLSEHYHATILRPGSERLLSWPKAKKLRAISLWKKLLTHVAGRARIPRWAAPA